MGFQIYNPNPEGRTLLNDITFERGSYSTNNGFDLNPFDIAYRSETKEQYYVDFTKFAGSVLTGTPGRLVRMLAATLEESLLD